MFKVCGILEKVVLKDVGGNQIAKLTIKDVEGGDYAPTHYVDDFMCRNWSEAKGVQVEIPCTLRVNGTFTNLNPLDSVKVSETIV